MIALLGASAIYLVATQAAISAPTDAFRACLRQSGEKAKAEKVGPDAYEAYVRNACTAEGAALKSAVITFRVKNGMSRKAAADDAEMTVDDYVATSVDKYKFMADFNKPAQAPATAAPAPAQAATAPAQATPASAPQPPKP